MDRACTGSVGVEVDGRLPVAVRLAYGSNSSVLPGSASLGGP
jgi:hypothetical protein